MDLTGKAILERIGAPGPALEALVGPFGANVGVGAGKAGSHLNNPSLKAAAAGQTGLLLSQMRAFREQKRICGERPEQGGGKALGRAKAGFYKPPRGVFCGRADKNDSPTPSGGLGFTQTTRLERTESSEFP
jgi:hypothetical protein